MASKVYGVDVMIDALRGASRSLKNAVPIVEMSVLLRGKIRQQLRKQGKGRRYKVPTKGQNVMRRWKHYPTQYRASSPGSPPATPTGNLRRAVHIRYNHANKALATASLVGVHGSRGVGALAVLLEHRMGRPFVIPTFEREKGNLERLALENIEKKILHAQKLLEGKAVAS